MEPRVWSSILQMQFSLSLIVIYGILLSGEGRKFWIQVKYMSDSNSVVGETWEISTFHILDLALKMENVKIWKKTCRAFRRPKLEQSFARHCFNSARTQELWISWITKPLFGWKDGQATGNKIKVKSSPKSLCIKVSSSPKTRGTKSDEGKKDERSAIGEGNKDISCSSCGSGEGLSSELASRDGSKKPWLNTEQKKK